ncbi:hypothetical protein Tco_1560037 [Tanacetum coccineum]
MSANKAKKKRPVTGPEQGYPRGSCQAGGSADYERRRKRALEQETWDLDMENEQKKKSKASYGVTTPQELRRNQHR